MTLISLCFGIPPRVRVTQLERVHYTAVVSQQPTGSYVLPASLFTYGLMGVHVTSQLVHIWAVGGSYMLPASFFTYGLMVVPTCYQSAFSHMGWRVVFFTCYQPACSHIECYQPTCSHMGWWGFLHVTCQLVHIWVDGGSYKLPASLFTYGLMWLPTC